MTSFQIKINEPAYTSIPRVYKTVLTTDASNYALGAVLWQSEVGSDLPVSYASKTFKKHDLSKPIIEKELLAIHWAITFFRPYLYGRKFSVIVSLFSHRKPSSKMTRISLDLCDYDFEIMYKKGNMNTNADALSRIVMDGDSLKTLIPTGNEKEPKETFAVTRNMNRKLNLSPNAKKDNVSDEKPDKLFIWECESISDVKGIKTVRFAIENKATIPQLKVDELEIIIRCSDNSEHTQMSLEKLISEMFSQGIKELALRDTDDII